MRVRRPAPATPEPDRLPLRPAGRTAPGAGARGFPEAVKSIDTVGSLADRVGAGLLAILEQPPRAAKGTDQPADCPSPLNGSIR